MDYQIVRRESYPVLAKVINVPTVNMEGIIPGFWTECNKDGTLGVLCKNGVKSELLGICEPEKKGEKTFRYGIGIECRKDVAVPEGFEVWNIPARTWAVFQCVGPMPESIQEMWKRIYSEFLPQSDYERLDETDIERYPEEDTKNKPVCEIWLPVRKKSE